MPDPEAVDSSQPFASLGLPRRLASNGHHRAGGTRRQAPGSHSTRDRMERAGNRPRMSVD
jgi:hypothetical protein